MDNDQNYENSAYAQGALSRHRSIGQRDVLMSPRGTHSRAADALLERHAQHKEPLWTNTEEKLCAEYTIALRPRVSVPLCTRV